MIDMNSLNQTVPQPSQNLIKLSSLASMDRNDFVHTLAGVFEHSPWVAEMAYAEHPFTTRADLERALNTAMRSASKAQQLALIRAHPELAGKAAIAGEMTDASIFEQANAGLSRCTPEQLNQIQSLNHTYMNKFGWPFIIAVRGMNVDSIIAAISTRIGHSAEEEFEQALTQISRIAGLRLDSLLSPRE